MFGVSPGRSRPGVTIGGCPGPRNRPSRRSTSVARVTSSSSSSMRSRVARPTSGLPCTTLDTVAAIALRDHLLGAGRPSRERWIRRRGQYRHWRHSVSQSRWPAAAAVWRDDPARRRPLRAVRPRHVGGRLRRHVPAAAGCSGGTRPGGARREPAGRARRRLRPALRRRHAQRPSRGHGPGIPARRRRRRRDRRRPQRPGQPVRPPPRTDPRRRRTAARYLPRRAAGRRRHCGHHKENRVAVSHHPSGYRQQQRPPEGIAVRPRGPLPTDPPGQGAAGYAAAAFERYRVGPWPVSW